jgi:hypothetical protein
MTASLSFNVAMMDAATLLTATDQAWQRCAEQKMASKKWPSLMGVSNGRSDDVC